jgi:epoxyqueuosine reductase
VPLNKSIEAYPKSWVKNLNIEALSWDEKKWKKNLQGTTLKRIKPWMWKRNIKAMLKNT